MTAAEPVLVAECADAGLELDVTASVERTRFGWAWFVVSKSRVPATTPVEDTRAELGWGVVPGSFDPMEGWCLRRKVAARKACAAAVEHLRINGFHIGRDDWWP